MKLCQACDSLYISSEDSCPACGYSPAIMDGFEAYSPEFGYGGGGFKACYFSELASLEEDNFWFRARNELIVWAMKKYAPNLRSFLEIGCGTGYVISRLGKEFPEAQMWGSEIFSAGLTFAAMRFPAAKFMQMDARHIPFQQEFDAIGAFDVLEHIEEDSEVLLQIRKSLKNKGALLLTVPQHQWLWSVSDEYACHVRRYSMMEIHSKLNLAGFQIERSTSFVSLLLAAMFISRANKKKSDPTNNPAAELKLPSMLNSLFFQTMKAEIGAIKAGVNFPIGGSRLVVARKID